MKVAIIGITNISFMPYISKYEEIIMEEKCEYDVIYWAREQEEIPNEHYIQYYRKSDFNRRKLFKLYDFINFRKFVKDKIGENKYDKIIVLTSLTGFFLADILLKNYKNNFILDIRDPSYEKIYIYRSILKKIINKSFITMISSEGFLDFLPKKVEGKYLLVHNLKKDSLKNRNIKNVNKNNEIVNIVFHGFVRHIEANVKLINILANDERFNLYYYGVYNNGEGSVIKDYASSKKIKNVFFYGEYNDNDRHEFLAKTDILHNVYNNDNTKYAMGNKFYDGIIYYIPQITTKGSFMGDVVEKNNLGITIDFNNCTSDYIYEWYKNFEWTNFKENCDIYLDEVLKDEENFSKKIREFIK